MTRWEWPELKEWALSEGPCQIAAGEILAIRNDFGLAREQDLAGLDFAISLAFPLPAASLGGIKDGPTLLYKHVYGQINYIMDRAAMGLALRLTEAGHRAIPIPASQIVDWERLTAHANHRQVAVHLGQGHYGRNNLLVTPRWGAQVRLVTVLTDARIQEPGPWTQDPGSAGCGDCRRCAAACPVGAIHEGPQDFDRPACALKTREFEKLRGIGQRICGLCVRACGPREGRQA